MPGEFRSAVAWYGLPARRELPRPTPAPVCCPWCLEEGPCPVDCPGRVEEVTR